MISLELTDRKKPPLACCIGWFLSLPLRGIFRVRSLLVHNCRDHGHIVFFLQPVPFHGFIDDQVGHGLRIPGAYVLYGFADPFHLAVGPVGFCDSVGNDDDFIAPVGLKLDVADPDTVHDSHGQCGHLDGLDLVASLDKGSRRAYLEKFYLAVDLIEQSQIDR